MSRSLTVPGEIASTGGVVSVYFGWVWNFELGS